MTGNTIERSRVAEAVARSGRVGQATAVEQSRAIAEVQAAMVMAKEFPRDVDAVVREMKRACSSTALAEKAFYSKPRGDKAVTGPSVHLARELMQIWGNVDFGVRELLRDDEHGQSEIQAIAWDLQHNNRSSSIYIVPHARFASGAVKKIVDLDQIYENNANNGARRLREAIYAVLPGWYVSMAEELCRETLRRGEGEPLAERAAKAVASFAKGNVSLDRLEAKIGRKQADWTEDDVVQLGIDYQSILRGDAKASEMFPKVDQGDAAADGIKAQAQRQQSAAAASAEPQPPADPPQPDGATDSITEAQLKKLHVLLGKVKVTAGDKHAVLSTLANREIASAKDLTAAEGVTLINMLDGMAAEDNPVAALDQVLADFREQAEQQDGAQ